MDLNATCQCSKLYSSWPNKSKPKIKMTKPSRSRRSKGKRWKFYTRPGKARGKFFTVVQRKSITRLAGSLKQVNIVKEDQKVFPTLSFVALPNEVICHVFSYLKIADLLKCGQVSKRLRAISVDSWPKKLNLCYKKVPIGFIQKLLDSGCKYLGLSEVILEGTMNLPNVSRLRYLNLSGFGLKNQDNAEKLLASCFSLQKLSLSGCHLSSKLINSISLQNGKTLRVLDLSNCSLSPIENSCFDCREPIHEIVENCTELKEFSLKRTNLPVGLIDILVFNLTSKIEKLDLFGMTYLRDEHVKILVTRCNKITDLNLGGSTSITKHSLNLISEHLQSTLVKLDFYFTEIEFDFNDLLVVKKMKKLKLFCCPLYGLYLGGDNPLNLEEDRRRMEKLLPNVWVDWEDCHGNARIARPSQLEYNDYSGVLEINHLQGIWEIKAESICPKYLKLGWKLAS